MSAEHKITKIEQWLLKRIAKRIVIQSEHHEDNIITYYTVIAEAADREFNEDNKVTLESFLNDCFIAAINRPN